MNRKQRSLEGLGDEQRTRKSAIRTDLLRIFGVLPSRSLLRHRNPIDEVARGEMPYEPFEKGVLMIRDGACAAGGLPNEKQDAYRTNVQAFCATLERYMLEPLATEEEADVIPLLFEETRVQSQGDQFQDMAKFAQSAENMLRVAEQMDRQARVSTRLRNACWRAANRGLSLVRPSHLEMAR